MFELSHFDLDEIATALQDQTDYEHAWLVDPGTGEIVFWTSDTGIDGQNPVDLEELDLLMIDPLPSSVWYEDMSDFAQGISDGRAARRLEGALRGRGAFRRFRNELYEGDPAVLTAWHAFHDTRAERRAVEWLLEWKLISEDAGRHHLAAHPDPALP